MLRSARHRHVPKSPAEPKTIHQDDDWLTLREASELTGVPTSTIRKWARHDNVPSLLEESDGNYVRLVSMEGIRRWTDEIGRKIEPGRTDGAEEADEVDLTSESPATETTSDAMLVPIDAWNRMLNQLGNLHEAGQQLAEARERAAKAETEARFLKERLADLRAEIERADQLDVAKSEPSPPATSSLVRKAFESWRSTRRRRS